MFCLDHLLRGNTHHKQRHAHLLLNGHLLVFNKNVKVGENIKRAIKTSVVEKCKTSWQK